MINTNGIKTDIDYERAKRAFYATSFSPERRGQSMVDEYIKTMEDLAQFITDNATEDRQKEVAQAVFDGLRDKFKKRYLAWIDAKSRCMSSMITGPANFPVRRAEKANNSEHNRANEVFEFANNMNKYALKNLNAVYSTQEKQETELEQQKSNLAAMELHQENMKAVNKAYKAFKKAPDSPTTIKLLSALSDGLRENVKTYVPEYSWEPNPFAPYQLSNNNANIKRVRERVAVLEVKSNAAKEHGELTQELNGLKVVRNFEEDRLQLLFDDKPSEEVRKVLKSNGFRWSPRFTAWQRKLTSNALYSLKNYVMTQDVMKGFTPLAV